MLPLIPKISQITNGIVRILGMNPSAMTLQGTNSYVIGLPSSKKRILIDTSNADQIEYINNVRQYFSGNDASKSYISDIILTHWHSDHIGSVPAILEFARSQNWPSPVVHKFASLSHPNCLDCKYLEIQPDKVFDLTSFGMGKLKVLNTPGHTDDHICLLLTPENILFSGDLILGHGSTVFENLGLYMDSLYKVEKIGKDVTTILPAHGLEVSSPVAKIEEYIKHRMGRIEEVYRALSHDQWRWEKEIIEKVYSREILENQKLLFGALSNQFQALDYLQRQDKVESRDPTDKEKESPLSDCGPSGKLWKSKIVKPAKL